MHIVLEEDAIDFIMQKLIESPVSLDDVYQKVNADFELGLKLVREKTGRNRFYITREALLNPEAYVRQLIQSDFDPPSTPERT